MTTVTFLAAPFSRRMVARVSPSGQRKLLSVIRAVGLPRDCESCSGLHGQCAVKVVVKRADSRVGRVRLGEEEKRALYEAGKIGREQYEAEELPDTPPLWRLVCQYVVREEDEIVVVL